MGLINCFIYKDSSILIMKDVIVLLLFDSGLKLWKQRLHPRLNSSNGLIAVPDDKDDNLLVVTMLPASITLLQLQQCHAPGIHTVLVSSLDLDAPVFAFWKMQKLSKLFPKLAEAGNHLSVSLASSLVSSRASGHYSDLQPLPG